jgi:hypothetical protein
LSSPESPAFTISNEFLKKLTSLFFNQRLVVLALVRKVNNHEAKVTNCGDEKFMAYDEVCKVYLDRKKWEVTNFEYNG